MLSALFQQRFPIILLLVGSVFVIISFFKIDDITKFQISAHSEPIYVLFAFGILQIITSIVMFLMTDSFPSLSFRSKIRKTKTGFEIQVKQTSLRVLFGQIENCDLVDSSCVVALPATEFFDDECINDKRSALGAYMYSTFPEQISNIQALISDNLAQMQSQEVEKELGIRQKSYGIGKCIYLDRPLTSNRRIILVSITTKRAGEGLQAEAGSLFPVIKAILQVMSDHRLSNLYIPLMGSGHGGLQKENALLIMVIAICEAIRSKLGHHLQSVNVIVFQKDEKTPPDISSKTVKQILSSIEPYFL